MAPSKQPTVPPKSPPAGALRAELDALLGTQGSDRVERLLASEHTHALVRTMPPEDLFFTLQAAAADQVPDVLSHARTEQVEFLLDLDLWKKDQYRKEQVAPWLILMQSCGAETFRRWLRDLELADLTLLLGQVLTVRLGSEEEDPFQEAQGSAPFTLDGAYYLFPSGNLAPLLKSFLAAIHEADSDRYYKLMEAILRDVNSELEEHCFEERQRRLGMRGFPEWEEAMQVYARLEVSGIDGLPARGAPRTPEPEEFLPPSYALAAVHSRGSRLGRALARVNDPGHLDTLRAELAFLTNQVAVADGLELCRPESLENALQKSDAYASIGLEILCGEDDDLAAEVLRERWLQPLFRLGWTCIRRMRTRARRLLDRGWPQGHKERLLFLDTPLPEMIEGLTRQHPLYFEGAAGAATYRIFHSLEEVRRAEWAVGKAEFLGQFLLSVVDLRLGDLRQALTRLDTENLKGSTVFLTALVNAALQREFRFAPVPRDAVRDGLGLIWESNDPPRKVVPSLGESAVDWCRALVPFSPKDEEYLRSFVADCFRLLEEEFGHLSPEEVPDPRFTRGLWLE